MKPGSDQIAALSLSGSGRHEVSRSGVSTRAFPYPFLGGFAIASGVEGYSRALFDDLQAFVAGRGATPHGDGLGLEIGGGFTTDRAQGGCLSFGDDASSMADENRIFDLIDAGWLDTVSGDAATVQRGLEAAKTRGLHLPVVLHSAFDEDADWGRGMEVVKESGSRYWSCDGLLERWKFGDHLDFRSDNNLHDALETYRWEQWSTSTAKVFDAEGGPISLFNNTIATTASLSAPLPFKRYRGPLFPTASTFPVQLMSAMLDDLQAKGGAVVLESHFGLWSLIGRRGPVKSVGSSALDDHAVACWRDVASRFTAGSLLVATVSRLLDYLWLRSHLKISVTRSADDWVVALDKVAVPGGGERDMQESDLNGLSLVVPSTAPEVVVVTPLRANPLPMKRASDPAGKRIDALYLPWSSLEYPIG